MYYCTFWVSEMSSNGSPTWMAILIRKGRPSPRLMSNTFEPIALETAISPNPSLATRMELRQSYKIEIKKNI